jgi:hypothetical protein
MNKFLNTTINKSFYDEIINAADLLSKNKSNANYVLTTGKCNCCGWPMVDENSTHDPECIWYKELLDDDSTSEVVSK